MNASTIKDYCARHLAAQSDPTILRLYNAAHDVFGQLEQFEGASEVPVVETQKVDVSEIWEAIGKLSARLTAVQAIQQSLVVPKEVVKLPWWKRIFGKGE